MNWLILGSIIYCWEGTESEGPIDSIRPESIFWLPVLLLGVLSHARLMTTRIKEKVNFIIQKTIKVNDFPSATHILLFCNFILHLLGSIVMMEKPSRTLKVKEEQ